MKTILKYISILFFADTVLLVSLVALIAFNPSFKSSFGFTIAVLFSVLVICFTILLAALSYTGIKAIYKLWQQTPALVKTISLAAILLGLAIAEVYLRHTGMQPGFTCTAADQKKIIPLDSLVDYKLFVADSFGVTKFNPLAEGGKFLHPWYANPQGFHSHHPFTQKTIDSCSATGLITLALIGDSYTYGGDADSGKTFADLLEQTGKYAVFNFGIPGTYPAQYEAVIKEYISSKALHFDKVAVVFCGANDVEGLREEKVIPGVPLMFNTNAGNLYGNTGDEPATTARQAYYDNIYARYTVTGLAGHNPIANVLARTVITSQLTGRVCASFKTLAGLLIMLYDKEFYSGLVSGLITHDNDLIARSSERIRKECTGINTELYFFLVPGREMVEARKTPDFGGIVSIDAARFTIGDYHNFGGNAHPLNSGHYKIFIEMDKLLRMH